MAGAQRPEEPTEMEMLGSRLRSQREQRGIALDDVAEATKIARHHLEALERNDLASLPGGTFNRGYVAAYARFLGLDPEPLLEEYARESRSQGLTEPSGEEIAREISKVLAGRDGEGRASRGRIVVLSAAVTALLILVGWFLLRGEPGGRVPPAGQTGRPVDEHRLPGDSPEGPGAAPRTSPAAETPPPASGAGLPRSGPAAAASAEQPETVSGRGSIPDAATHLSVAASAVGTGVVDRQIVGDGQPIRVGMAVFFWTRVIGGQDGDAIRHVWTHEGRTVETIDLRIGGPRWRTHSRKTMYAGSVGSWTVEARDARGRVLARHEFTCLPDGGS